MKVLNIHNKYLFPGGEDVSVSAEVALLRNYGHQVLEYYRHNSEIEDYGLLRKLSLYFRTTWARDSYEQIREICRKEKPDIAHFSNTLPLISPSAYYACKEEGVPVVQTLHNFRFICPGSLLMRNGKICEECLGGSLRPALMHRCYRNSYFQTRAIVRMLKTHYRLGTYRDMIDRYIALTEFSRQKFIQGGLLAEKISVRPNFLAGCPEAKFGGDYAIYIGRLSAEKGINILIQSWKRFTSFPLKVVGDGPLRMELERLSAPNVEFIGQVRKERAIQLLLNARFLIFPSVCYETFGRVLIEAFACGKPAVASRLGSAAEIVEDEKTGLLFEPGNSEDLAEKAKHLIDDPSLAIRLGQNARDEFEAKYLPEKNYQTLIKIYESILGRREQN